MPLEREWPPINGDYTLGCYENPVGIVVVGRGEVDIPHDRFSILGRLKTENLGIERIIINVISNPHIRFLVVCGREEFGHFPGDALVSLLRNGTDDRMRIIGTKAAVPFLCNIDRELIDRFRKQLEVIDLVHPKEVDEIIEYDPKYVFDEERTRCLLEVVERCARESPGPFEGEDTVRVERETFEEDIGTLGKKMNILADHIVSQMLRMPSQELSTSAAFITVSDRFKIIADPVDGVVMTVPSVELLGRLKSYLTGAE